MIHCMPPHRGAAILPPPLLTVRHGGGQCSAAVETHQYSCRGQELHRSSTLCIVAVMFQRSVLICSYPSLADLLHGSGALVVMGGGSSSSSSTVSLETNSFAKENTFILDLLTIHSSSFACNLSSSPLIHFDSSSSLFDSDSLFHMLRLAPPERDCMHCILYFILCLIHLSFDFSGH